VFPARRLGLRGSAPPGADRAYTRQPVFASLDFWVRERVAGRTASLRFARLSGAGESCGSDSQSSLRSTFGCVRELRVGYTAPVPSEQKRRLEVIWYGLEGVVGGEFIASLGSIDEGWKEIVREYKERFSQEAVMVVRTPVTACF